MVLFVNGTPRVVVRGPTRVLLTRNVDKEIKRPSKGEHEKHGDEHIQRSFFKYAVRSIRMRVIFALRQAETRSGNWDENLIARHVSSSLMVTRVRDSP